MIATDTNKQRDDKRQAALRLLEKTGIMRSNYAPPYLRLLWRMGFDVAPPHFAQFWQNALFSGSFYTVGWGLLMYFFVWSKVSIPLILMLKSSIIAGFLFGLTLACYYAYGKRKHGLLSWQDFKPDTSS